FGVIVFMIVAITLLRFSILRYQIIKRFRPARSLMERFETEGCWQSHPLVRAAVSRRDQVTLIDIFLRDRHFASDSERAAGDFQSGRGLLALVFVQVDAALHPAHGFFIKASGDDVARAH